MQHISYPRSCSIITHYILIRYYHNKLCTQMNGDPEDLISLSAFERMIKWLIGRRFSTKSQSETIYKDVLLHHWFQGMDHDLLWSVWSFRIDACGIFSGHICGQITWFTHSVSHKKWFTMNRKMSKARCSPYLLIPPGGHRLKNCQSTQHKCNILTSSWNK